MAVNPALINAGVEAMRLIANSIEAAQNGDDEKAMGFFRQMQDRLKQTDEEWQKAFEASQQD